MLAKTYAIAVNTFLESVRQPVYGVVIVATFILMILNVGVAGFTLDDDDKLLAELGLSTLLLSGLFLASFSATSVVTREIENKTVMTVISKPVSRTVFLLGKYLGLVASLALAYYLGFLAFFFSMQHEVLQTSADTWHLPVFVFGFGGIAVTCLAAAFRNFLTGKEFVTMALWLGTPLLTLGAILTCFFSREFQPQPFLRGLPDPYIIMAAGMIFCAVLVLAAVALAASTRLGQVMTLLVCLGVLMVGFVLDYMLSDLARKSTVADLVYRHLPNFSLFWIIDPINAGHEIPESYILYCILYAAVLSGAAFLFATALFQRREVG